MTDTAAVTSVPLDVRRFALPSGAVSAEFLTGVLDTVRADGIAVLQDFPADPAQLLRFATRFGDPEPRDQRERPDPADTMKWVTRVWYRTDLPDDAKRLYTQGAVKLDLHTARAAAPAQPRLFLMLMADPGDRLADPAADNGQSQFARVDDAWARLCREHGRSHAEWVFRVLSEVPISTFQPYPDEPVVAPILHRAADGRWRLRYWEGIREHAAAGETAARLGTALTDFDAALVGAQVETVLTGGDLVLLDNDRVAHGRRAFPAWWPRDAGDRRPSSRLIYNLHTFSELTVLR